MTTSAKGLLALVVVLVALAAATAARADPYMYMYVSMGDSYSAGTGTGPYEDATCRRGREAWTRFLIPSGPYGFDELACAGATIDAFYHEYLGQPAQLQILRDDVARRMPDGSPWNPRIGATKMVTLTVGGNDIGFAKLMSQCFIITCLSTSQFNAVQKDIQALRPRFLRLLQQIKAIVPPQAAVIVVGYPRIFPARQADAKGCGWLTDAEREEINYLTKKLDDVEAGVVNQAGATFVSTYDALAGHELCTKNSWMIPLGTKPLWAGGAGHPDKLAHEAIADLIRPLVPSFDYQAGG